MGIDLRNEIGIYFLGDEIGLVIVIKIERFDLGMGIQVENGFIQVAFGLISRS